MIKDRKVEIKITPNILNKFKPKYNCTIGDKIIIDINDLSENSHTVISSICDVCGSENKISFQKYNKNFKKYNIYTCHKCSIIKNKKTNLEKYGVEYPLQSGEIRNKLKKTNLKKYGVENVFSLDMIKIKIKETNLEKFGVEYPLQNIEILNKSIKTNLEKYKTERPSQNSIIKEKIKETNLEKFGVEYPLQNKEIINKLKKTNLERYGVDNSSKIKKHNKKIQGYYKNKMKLKYDYIINVDYDKYIYNCKCDKGHEYFIDIGLFHNRLSHKINTCTICFPMNELKSIKEKELLNFIEKNYNGKIILNDRKILNGKELDIYLPNLNLAFEFNGLYWHSNIYKNDNYHYNKIKDCLKNNIMLINIWEDEWIYNNEYIKKNILNILNNNDKIEIDSFVLNDKFKKDYNIVKCISPKKWNINSNKRIEYNIESTLPYIIDTGKIILEKNV